MVTNYLTFGFDRFHRYIEYRHGEGIINTKGISETLMTDLNKHMKYQKYNHKLLNT